MNKNLKIVLLTGTAAVCAVGAFFLHRSDEQAGTVNSVRSVETAIADKTFRTKSEAYEAFANGDVLPSFGRRVRIVGRGYCQSDILRQQ